VMEYGTTREYKNKVDISGIIPKGTYVFSSTQLTGLDSATVYYYRIKAKMGNELIYSAEKMLKLKKDIIMIPIDYKQLSDSSVLLQGLINSNGSYLSTIEFHYGLTESLSDSVLATPSYTYNYATILASATLYHLTPGVKYFAMLSATNGTSKLYSEPFTFTLIDASLATITDNLNVVIYPNPATNYLMINSIKTVDKVELSDLTGKVLITSKNETKINISHLQNGFYLVQIYIGDKVNTKKMIKN